MGYPVNIKTTVLTPYVSDEIFYDTVPGQLNQNRISLGIEFHFHRSLGMRLYYLLRSERFGSDWDESHILGTALMIKY